MPGMATQNAPEKRQTPKAARGPQKQTEKKGLKEKLRDMPQAAGIAALVLMCVLALPIGNMRALQNVTPQAFLRQGDVKSIVEDRVAQAGNALTVASRADISETLIDDVRSAMSDLQKAKTAREISRADQRLTSAMSELVFAAAEELTGENSEALTRAADNFAEQGSFLRQEAKAFNQQAQKAEKLYEKLPTKFLLSEPDMYEGI